MIYLEDLKEDVMLTVHLGPYGDFSVMTKADFLNSAEYLDMDIKDTETIPTVTVADKVVHVFDWDSVVEGFDEESYEDFSSDFWIDVTDEDQKILNQAKEIVNRILENNPTWYEGKAVEVAKEADPNGK